MSPPRRHLIAVPQVNCSTRLVHRQQNSRCLAWGGRRGGQLSGSWLAVVSLWSTQKPTDQYMAAAAAAAVLYLHSAQQLTVTTTAAAAPASLNDVVYYWRLYGARPILVLCAPNCGSCTVYNCRLETQCPDSYLRIIVITIIIIILFVQ